MARPRPRGATIVAVVWAIGAVGLITWGAVLLQTFPPVAPRPAILEITVTATLGFLIAAVVLATHPGQRTNAVLLAAAGTCSLLSWHVFHYDNVLRLVGFAIGQMAWGFAAWAALRYPDDRLEARGQRVFVVVLMLWMSVAHTVRGLFFYPPRHGNYDDRGFWPTIINDRAIDDLSDAIYVGGTALLAAWYLTLAVRRIARLHGTDRWLVWPLVAAAVSVGLSVVAYASIPLFLDKQGTAGRVIESIPPYALPLLPLAFLVSALRRSMLRWAIADLVIRLNRSTTPTDVREALRATLRHPTLDVLYSVPETREWVDTAGQPVRRPSGAGVACIEVESSDGEPLALIVAESSLSRHGDLVDAVVSASRLALENARLHASVRSQLDQIVLARRETAHAGLAERRRLERDLHDGIQQQLVALTMTLARHEGVTDDAVAQVVREARRGLHAAIGEIRSIARGVHPAVVQDAGLAVALQDVAADLPLPVTVDVPSTRWDPDLEVAIYYLVCEALTNTAKHAHATQATVRVRQTEEGELRIMISDDGVGGAVIGGGSGLTGVVERVELLGGSVRIGDGIERADGGFRGTMIDARLPCT